MYVQPQSTVTLYSGIETGRKIAFSSRANQQAYFARHMAMQAVNCTNIKKTGKIRLEVAGSVVKNCNYISFINPNFDNLTVYCLITDYDYVNNECTDISWSIDWFQTYMFNVTYRSGNILREHLSSADYDLSLTDPYNPAIEEFKTAENITVSKDLEEPYKTFTYNYSGDETAMYCDSEFTARVAEKALDVVYGASNGTYTMICMSNVDVDDLPGSESAWFQSFIDYAKGTSQTPPSGCVADKMMCHEPGLPIFSFNTDMQTELNTSANAGAVESNLSMPYYVFIGEANNNNIETLLEHITLWGGVNAVIGLYSLPLSVIMAAFPNINNSGTVITQPLAINVRNSKYFIDNKVNNKKLLNFPFSYIRMHDSLGNEKEYYYENFYRGGTTQTDCPFTITGRLGASIQMDLAPMRYKNYNMVGSSQVGFDERMSIANFPQLGYNTDAFLTYIAGKVASVARTDNLEYRNMKADELSQSYAYARKDLEWDAQQSQQRSDENAMANAMYASDVGMASSIASGAAGAANALTQDVPSYSGAASSAGGSLSSAVSNMLNKDTKEFMSKALDNANALARTAFADNQSLSKYNLQTAIQKRTMYADPYANYGLDTLNENLAFNVNSLARSSFAVSDYHAGTMDGADMYSRYCSIDFSVEHVRLRDEVLALYDKYFDAFGYTSMRYGVPRICNFIGGSSSTSDIPHFATIDGMQITYVKTQDMEVVCPMKPIEDYFKAMFNGGVQFINGDVLQ